MTVEMEIKNVEDLLSSLLTDGRKLVSCESKRLLASGENYGSVMLKLTVKLEGVNGKETVNCVAKLVPPTAYLWQMFNTPVTFKKEVGIYNMIGPTLNNFGKEHGVENLLPIFADFVGARFSLDPKSDEVDNDAALILKNMTTEGFVVGDRFTGFDRKTMVLLLRDLATLHASVIALKLAKPDEFKRKVFSLISSNIPVHLNEETMRGILGKVEGVLSKNGNCDNVMKKLSPLFLDFHDLISDTKEPFSTLIHNDLWTNNVMVKFENGEPTSTKFLDFQIVEYGNPARDVLFLIYSSAKLELLTEVDEFFNAYFEHFITTLKRLHCDTTQFTKELFFEEVASAAPKEIIHTVYMLQPIFTKKGSAKELSEMKGDNDILLSDDTIHENYYPRLHFVVNDYVKRGWL